jgi:phage terminase large subunit GpA-like protein
MPTLDEIKFLRSEMLQITNTRKFEDPSDYIESVRYLPPELTPKPGYYDYDYTPYLRELVNNLSPMSPVRKMAFMKPSQIGATVGILESAVGYFIGCAPTSILFVTADKDLAKKGMEVKIEQMIDSCNLRDKIFAQTKGGNNRRTGDTKTEKEFVGGFLHAIGAQSAGKLRQMSYATMLMDELDGFPDEVGKEGDPVSLAENRTNAFAAKRKILYLSTPTVQQTSKIYPLYLKGDQRHWHVPCPRCGEKIVMQWHIKTDTGIEGGVIFETEGPDQILIPESVRYRCQACGGIIEEKEKATYLNEGEWIPTSKTHERGLVSYWLDATYSPLGMYSWVNLCYDWLDAWDVEGGRVKNLEKYKSFRNTKQGKPYEERGESVSYERVISHRRPYAKNRIDNSLAIAESGAPVLMLTAAVDVQKSTNELLLDVKAWCAGGRSYTIDFRAIPASEDVRNANDECWQELTRVLETETWAADDGREYRIAQALVDSGWASDTVYEFCKPYGLGVSAIKGQDYLNGEMSFKPMSKEVQTRLGMENLFMLNTTALKRRISRALAADWNTGELQPEWYMNFPEDMRDDFFKMFTSEYLVTKRDKRTGKFKGFEWRAKQGAPNHAFDTAAYNLAALEMVADYRCKNILGLETIDWVRFWDHMKAQQLSEVDKKAG